MVSMKKNPLFVLGWDRKICTSRSPFVITWQDLPISDPQNRFFYPTLTLMMDSYNLILLTIKPFQEIVFPGLISHGKTKKMTCDAWQNQQNDV